MGTMSANITDSLEQIVDRTEDMLATSREAMDVVDVDDLLDQYRNIAKGIAACFANENSSSVVLTEEEEREALENLQKIADEFDMDELMKWEKIYQHTTALPERQIFWEDIVQAVKDVSFMEIVEKIEEYPFTNS